ncbi:acyl-phosphate glycerol 3-phosphate acyltransferase [Prauserella marina]|nr:acyl-phosphate glycerol 3-phosphate acyltransferase [Prauserella marina]
MPVSTCDAACRDAEEPPSVALPRRVLRLFGLLLVLVLAIVSAPTLMVMRNRQPFVRFVFRCLLAACGVGLVVNGKLAGTGRGALVVHNHISWLDIVGLNAIDGGKPLRALAKREIASWPVLGGLVAKAGGVFLERERLSTLPATVANLAEVLRKGAIVAVSPEGTTWCGRASGRFRPALFQAAITGGVPVQPVALRYRTRAGRETAQPSFVGTDTLLDSVRRVLRTRGLVLELFVCPEIAPGRAGDRAELAGLAEAAVHAALGTASVPSRANTVASSRGASLRGGPCPTPATPADLTVPSRAVPTRSRTLH